MKTAASTLDLGYKGNSLPVQLWQCGSVANRGNRESATVYLLATQRLSYFANRGSEAVRVPHFKLLSDNDLNRGKPWPLKGARYVATLAPKGRGVATIVTTTTVATTGVLVDALDALPLGRGTLALMETPPPGARSGHPLPPYPRIRTATRQWCRRWQRLRNSLASQDASSTRLFEPWAIRWAIGWPT